MKGVIFDLDGVIVDTAKYHYLGWKKLADKIGVDFDEKKNEKLKGVSRRDSLIAMLGYTPDEDKMKKWCAQKNGYYLKNIDEIKHDDMLPGSLELLSAINEKADYKQALASSSKNARLVIEKLDIKKYFNAVVDGAEVIKAKPDPELFIKASDKLEIHPENIVVFEDAQSGIDAAKSAGMIAVGVGEEENLSHADYVIKDLSEITLEKIDQLLSKGILNNHI